MRASALAAALKATIDDFDGDKDQVKEEIDDIMDQYRKSITEAMPNIRGSMKTKGSTTPQGTKVSFKDKAPRDDEAEIARLSQELE